MSYQQSRPKPPSGWPQSIRYLDGPVLSKQLTIEQVAEIKRNSLDMSSSAPNILTEVHNIQSSRCPVNICTIAKEGHPAFGQQGLFASRHLEPSSFILAYLGYVHGESESDPASDYDLSLDREHGISVDASSMGNEARFINDYRGIRSQGPNAEFKDCWLHLKGAGSSTEARYQKCIGVFVLSKGKSGKRKTGIAQGEEILVSYGKGFWSERSASQVEE